MATAFDRSDRLLVGQVVTAAPVSALSHFEAWDLAETIIAQLVVASAATDSSDTLIAKVQHSIDKVSWVDLITFETVAGNETVPYAEVLSVGKGSGDKGWGPWLRAVAVPSGGTASFVIGEVRIVGS